MPFFEYNQNNSGGVFHFDDRVTSKVIIEAANAKEADEKAEDIGIYFDGVSAGRDCSCCGSRWHRAWDDEGDKELHIYGAKPEELIVQGDTVLVPPDKEGGKPWETYKWRKGGPEVYVYFADGRQVGYL
jgi:hypothetical protein